MALGAGLVLAGVVLYLLLAKAGPNQGTMANRSGSGAGLAGHGIGNGGSSPSTDSATTKRDADDSSADFSGIKSTLDPARTVVSSTVTFTACEVPAMMAASSRFRVRSSEFRVGLPR
jgi:hypothetical protein